MHIRDLKGRSKTEKAFNAAISTNTTTNGDIIDMKEAGAAMFASIVQAFTDGSYLPLVEHGDDSGLSDAAAVPDDQLSGTEAAATLDAADEVSTIGYQGFKRYVRLSFVSTGVTTGATIVTVVTKTDLEAPTS